MNEAFFAIHSDLPREGPGDRETLDRALGVLSLPPRARMLDAGCGPGADIVGLLAHAPGGSVVAIDTHAPFVDQVAARHYKDDRVWPEIGDLGQPSGRFDLIWSAGAVYFVGITAALAAWRPHLAPGGAFVFSQLAWRVADPAPEARAFWAVEYPEITDAAGVRAAVRAAGYRIVTDFWLSDAAWEAYYGPLEARLDMLEPEAGPDLREAIAAERREIALWRTHGGDFGYLQVVAVPQ